MSGNVVKYAVIAAAAFVGWRYLRTRGVLTGAGVAATGGVVPPSSGPTIDDLNNLSDFT